MLKMIEFTKDCGYETRTAQISKMRGFYRISIEGSHNVYEYETETFEGAIALVKRFGFDCEEL